MYHVLYRGVLSPDCSVPPLTEEAVPTFIVWLLVTLPLGQMVGLGCSLQWSRGVLLWALVTRSREN